MKQALFLDRDGTLIVDVGYPRDPALVEPLPGAIEALRELQRTYELVIVSNQSGVGRGRITNDEAYEVHERVIQVFRAEGVWFSGVYYCLHAPDAGCACRKPAPGMLLEAARELRLDLASSVMLGDKASDIEAGRAAGVGRLLRFGADAGDEVGVARCDDWSDVLTNLRNAGA